MNEDSNATVRMVDAMVDAITLKTLLLNRGTNNVNKMVLDSGEK